MWQKRVIRSYPLACPWKRLTITRSRYTYSSKKCQKSNRCHCQQRAVCPQHLGVGALGGRASSVQFSVSLKFPRAICIVKSLDTFLLRSSLVSDPWRAYWASSSPFNLIAYVTSGSKEIKVQGHCSLWLALTRAPRIGRHPEHLTQTLIVWLLKAHLLSMIRKEARPGTFRSSGQSGLQPSLSSFDPLPQPKGANSFAPISGRQVAMTRQSLGLHPNWLTIHSVSKRIHRDNSC